MPETGKPGDCPVEGGGVGWEQARQQPLRGRGGWQQHRTGSYSAERKNRETREIFLV